jgi:inorganic pyrophosphatase
MPESQPPDGIIDVMVEIPRGSRNKYEYDHENHVIRLDRRLFSATVYPADYGFVPDTLAEDGDPLDALVLTDDPTFPGCMVSARPVGLLWMTDEKGPDAKLICVLQADPRWQHVAEIEQLPRDLLDEIEHFFEVYKDLEPDKTATTAGFEGAAAAWSELEASIARAGAADGTTGG